MNKITSRIRIVFLLISSTFLASSCLNLDSKKEEKLSETTDFNTVNINNEYNLRVPKYMSEAKNLNDDASLQYQNIFKETYVIVIDEDKENFVQTFADLGEYDSALSVVENYRIIQLKSLQENMTVKYQADPAPGTIHDLPSQFVQMDGSVEGVKSDISYFLTFIEGNKNVYMIMAWTLKDRKEKYKTTMESIGKSFKLI